MKPVKFTQAALLSVLLWSVGAAHASVIDFASLKADLARPVSPTVGGLIFSDSQQYIVSSVYGPNSYSGNVLTSILSNASNDTRYLTITSATGGAFDMNSFLAAQNSCCGQSSGLVVTGNFESGSTSTLDFSLSKTSYSDAVLNWTGLKSIVMKSDVGFGGYYTFQSFTTAAVSAVPEPETYGMLFAGLGLLGVMARRKSAGKV